MSQYAPIIEYLESEYEHYKRLQSDLEFKDHFSEEDRANNRRWFGMQLKLHDWIQLLRQAE
jgi:hypothetical protein